MSIFLMYSSDVFYKNNEIMYCQKLQSFLAENTKSMSNNK